MTDRLFFVRIELYIPKGNRKERNFIQNAQRAQSALPVSPFHRGHRGVSDGVLAVLHCGRSVRRQGRGRIRHVRRESGGALYQRAVLHRHHLRRGQQHHHRHLPRTGAGGKGQRPVLPESGAAGGHRPDHLRAGVCVSGAVCPAAGRAGRDAALHHRLSQGARPLCRVLHRILQHGGAHQNRRLSQAGHPNSRHRVPDQLRAGLSGHFRAGLGCLGRGSRHRAFPAADLRHLSGPLSAGAQHVPSGAVQNGLEHLPAAAAHRRGRRCHRAVQRRDDLPVQPHHPAVWATTDW